MTRVKISVTQDDIDHGEHNDCVTCPIAKALTRTVERPLVMDTFVSVGIDDGYAHVALPRSAQRFIRRFDNYKPVEPFKFFLNLPDGVTV